MLAVFSAFCLVLGLAKLCVHAHFAAMLTRLYIEALLVDEELADQVWEAWIVGELHDSSAYAAWLSNGSSDRFRSSSP